MKGAVTEHAEIGHEVRDDTDEVLSELGYSTGEIAVLRDAGIV